MSEEQDVKMVPAICTQCGGTLTVDPAKETGIAAHREMLREERRAEPPMRS